MTCVLALKFIDETDKQVVLLAADKMGSNGSVKRIYTKPKIFKNGDFYIGYSTSFCMGQILQHVWTPPEQKIGQTDDDYLFNDVRASLHKMFEDNDFGFKKSESNGEPNRGTFIMVYKGRIFEVFSNMALLEVDGFASVGCGSEIMQGAIGMYLSLVESADILPDNMLDKAFKIVSERSCGVSKEYDLVVIHNDCYYFDLNSECYPL